MTKTLSRTWLSRLGVSRPSQALRPSQVQPGGGAAATEVSHMLLYLNNNTFVGPAGEALADEVRAALKVDMPLLMLHENDEANGGCPFARFFETTPQARYTYCGPIYCGYNYCGSTLLWLYLLWLSVLWLYILWPHLLGSHRRRAVQAARARALLRLVLAGLRRASGQLPRRAQRRGRAGLRGLRGLAPAAGQVGKALLRAGRDGEARAVPSSPHHPRHAHARRWRRWQVGTLGSSPSRVDDSARG